MSERKAYPFTVLRGGKKPPNETPTHFDVFARLQQVWQHKDSLDVYSEKPPPSDFMLAAINDVEYEARKRLAGNEHEQAEVLREAFIYRAFHTFSDPVKQSIAQYFADEYALLSSDKSLVELDVFLHEQETGKLSWMLEQVGIPFSPNPQGMVISSELAMRQMRNVLRAADLKK